MQREGRVTVVGSFNVDHVWTAPTLPLPGETLSGSYRSGPGGKGFNQAVAAARAGARTHFICALGDDTGGQLARALAAADDIDLRERISDAPTGTAGIFVGAAGTNSIVIGPGANACLDAAFVEAQRSLLAGSAVVLAQLETPADSALLALRIAREGGALAVLNPAPANAPVPAALLAQADVITPNETEFAALMRVHAGKQLDPEALAALSDDALHAHCRGLFPQGTVVVTLGAAGCFVSHAPDRQWGDADAYYRFPAERVNAVDTTGAGDAFSGALVASMAREPAQAFAMHVRAAGRYAALSTENAGAALAMPRLEQLLERFGR